MEQSSSSLILGLIDPNIINYQTVLLLLGTYFAAMWLMFCIWVFLDAYKRYKSWFMPAVFALIVLPFNVPGFILYLIARPEDPEYLAALASDPGLSGSMGGVQMPMMQFVGEDGKVRMSINLELDPKIGGNGDLDVGVKWISTNSNFVAGANKVYQESEKSAEPQSKLGKMMTTHLKSFRDRASSSVKAAQSSLSNTLAAAKPKRDAKKVEKEGSETEAEAVVAEE